VCGFEYRGKKHSIEHFALVADSGQCYVALGIGLFLFSYSMKLAAALHLLISKYTPGVLESCFPLKQQHETAIEHTASGRSSI